MTRPFVLERRTALTLAGLAAALVVALVVPFYSSTYWNYQLSMIFVWAIAAYGLNLVTGYLGQISLGHGAFFAAGAYLLIWGVEDQGLPLAVVLAIAAVATLVAGYAVGTPALRLRGLYLAMLTLALGVGVLPVLKRMEGLTGGVTGRNVTQPEAPSWLSAAPDQYVYLLCLLMLVGTALLARRLARGELGRSLVAIRENETVAAAQGIDVARHKQLAFAISAMLAGLAGAMYAMVVGYVSPNAFGIFLGINLLVAVVAGGMGTLLGPLLGAVFIQLLPIAAGEVDQALSGMAYGVFLIVAMLAMPLGLVGLGRSVADRASARRAVRGAGARSRGSDGSGEDPVVEAARS
ncbi:branched-chain amino acid ABC transporter permease [Patulibacter defluvii]|uniref:branched-chain amino acid ABC transporter permease n=1 Tax=Patulibacter defluvii TaxID=3095358 RepID=UPI002A763752|nr:branched-chain amino acid ABC transporter permease [Patulibacter sp. DM4]